MKCGVKALVMVEEFKRIKQLYTWISCLSRLLATHQLGMAGMYVEENWETQEIAML